MDIIKQLNKIGRQAALNHPKCKLWAKVNCEDNFALVISSVVDLAIMDLVSSKIIENDNKEWRDWYDDNVKNLDKIALSIGRKVYKELPGV